MTNPYIHPRLRPMFELAELLAREASQAVRQDPRFRFRRRHYGQTLRPGVFTPLWNALAAEATRLLPRHGTKAELGRYLGVPRQRVHDYLKARSAMPDAERTLRLVAWVVARHEHEGRYPLTGPWQGGRSAASRIE
ncbi:MAG: hypothetical protein JSR48_15830 [Verrucomicrobia bacterium]|nr:hypothetical protein [Verrucomicrobiota bacterium]